MTTPTLTEVWNLDMLHRVINHADLNDVKLAHTLTRVMSSIDRNTGELVTTYKHGKSIDFGRLYAYPSLQSVPGWVRRLCAHGLYHDLDIVNCFPVILRQVFTKNGLQCPYLTQYVQHREQCFAHVQQTSKVQLSRKEVKTCFLRIIHNGDYRKVTKQRVPYLEHLQAEIRGAAEALMNTKPFAWLKEKVMRSSSKENKLGTFISWVCQVAENNAIQAARSYIGFQQRQVDVLVFDGLMVRSHGVNTHLPEQILRGTEQAALEATGYAVQFTEKSLEPTSEDWARLGAPPSRTFFPNATEIDDSVHYVGNIVFAPETRAVLIKAAMGLGKSTAAKRFLRQKNPQRVLCITARRQQAHTLLGELGPLGFAHYQDAAVDLGSVDRLIIQYESLYRLMSGAQGLQPYDFIVVDEIRAVVGQVVSTKTNKHNLAANATLLKQLLQISHCLFMDADLEHDQMVKILVDEVWPAPERTQVLRYTHIALKRTLAPMEKDAWTFQLKGDLQAGKRVMVAFRTKSELNTTLAMARQWIPEIKFLAFSADSTGAAMAAFQKINEALQDVQLLCFTSKVTVGADIQVRFDAVYMNAVGYDGCCARDMFQMIGRARRVQDPCIRVTLPARKQVQKHDDDDDDDKVRPGLVPFSTKLKELAESQKLREKHANVMAAVGITVQDGRLQWSPNWIIQLLACSLAESDSDFTTAFLDLARRKQYTIVATVTRELTDDAQRDLRATRQQAQRESREQQEALALEALKEIQELNCRELLEQHNRLKKQKEQGEATSRDQVKLKLVQTCLRFPHNYKAMELKGMQYAARNMAALNKLWWLRNAQNVREFFMEDSKHLESAPIPEVAKLLLTQLLHTQQAVQQVGFRDLWDFGSTVSSVRFARHAQEVLRLCDRAADYEMRRKRGRTRNPTNRAINALRRELGTIGYRLVERGRHREGPEGKRVTHYCMEPNRKLLALAMAAEFPVSAEVEDERTARILADFEGSEARSEGRPRKRHKHRGGKIESIAASAASAATMATNTAATGTGEALAADQAELDPAAQQPGPGAEMDIDEINGMQIG